MLKTDCVLYEHCKVLLFVVVLSSAGVTECLGGGSPLCDKASVFNAVIEERLCVSVTYAVTESRWSG